jgi:DNA-directed RNA polymerase specialized sigma24 family protein
VDRQAPAKRSCRLHRSPLVEHPELRLELRETLHPALLPNASLAEFYRYALLLTGNIKTAEQIMADTLAEVEAQLSELRHEASRQAWLATRIRQRCLRENAGGGTPVRRLLRDEEAGAILRIEAFIVAQHISTLPEPERSALALFYLDLFTNEDIAKLLKLDLDELSETLARARELLSGAMHAAK